MCQDKECLSGFHPSVKFEVVLVLKLVKNFMLMNVGILLKIIMFLVFFRDISLKKYRIFL